MGTNRGTHAEPTTVAFESPSANGDIDVDIDGDVDANANANAGAVTTMTTKELAALLAVHTPREFRAAVKQSGGRFLYRGAEPNQSRDCDSEILVVVESGASGGAMVVARTCHPPPDLLLPDTYGSYPSALDYFRRLEALFSDVIVAKPSNGHVATSDPSEAGQWGPVVSVWPLLPQKEEQEQPPPRAPPDTEVLFSYVWPQTAPVFVPGNANLLEVNQRLEDALQKPEGREVLFCSFVANSNQTSKAEATAAFVAVPAELDGVLRQELEAIGYGL
jgi:hypothetical protein